MSKSKSKSKGLRAHASRTWNKTFGPLSPSAPPSRTATPVPPTVVLSPPAPEQSGSVLHAPVMILPLPAPPASAPPSPILRGAALPPPSPSPTLSIRIPEAISEPQSASNRRVAWSGLKTALSALHTSAEFFPPLQSVVGGLLSTFDTVEEAMVNREECGPLVRELKVMSETLDRHLPGMIASSMMDFILEQIQLIQNQLDVIAKIQERYSIGRLIQAEQIRGALTKCDQYIRAISRQLQIDTDLSMRSKGQNDRLEGIQPARLATYNSSLSAEVNRRACTENTRTSVLSDLDGWLDDPNSPKVCWMNGMAGTGKTTIAYTFAQKLDESKRLAASFFCTGTTPECRDVARILPTVAYQLARFSYPFLGALCDVLKNNPDLLSLTIPTQFDRMITQPLRLVKEQMRKGTVIVIDALDECAARNGAKLFLDILLREAHDLPVKFFVTSRPEPRIQNSIEEQPVSSRSIYELHTVKQSEVKADIELYLREELPSVQQFQIQQLVAMSGSLFIYAATVVRYICGGDQKERLKTMLSVESTSTRKHAKIDELYSTILTAAFGNEELEPTELERIKLALWTTVCSRESMSVKTLAVLSGIDDEDRTLVALGPLRSVLYVSDNREVVSTLHTSFSDYLFDLTRSASFFCNGEQHNTYLARQCFEVMKGQLRFNICGLESSYTPDDNVANIEKRIVEAILPILAYTCRYWADHLEKAPRSDELHEELERFVSERLLLWMEVMNLKKWMGLAVRVMLTAKLWIQTRYPSSKVLKLAEDARKFAVSVAANPMTISTPHIYISALPFCRRASMVYAKHVQKTQGLIKPNGPGIDNRRGTVVASWDVEPRASSVAYSHDGTRLVVGCQTGDILIKDVYTGAPVCDSLRGHAGSVWSVVFSPDSTRIISGSDDNTIRMWNAEDGTAIGPPLRGHTSFVWSVAFSPDGTRIVSGSNDNTIRMWNTEDGTAIGPPLRGHTNCVWSVSFSPGGTRLVSGSHDKTIRLWNAEDGAAIGAPLRGHTDCVKAVAFSPDGTRIVSGSWDRTIRRWNAKYGTTIGPPLRGHTDCVWSVAFSPDGTRIVSGSNDNTIRLWNAEDGTAIGRPLQGHTRPVWSVAFSPDGTRIVSGSWDNTIRLWDAEARTAIDAPLQGHTDCVRAVAFSPDGTRIVSGSFDNTIRLWNAEDGAAIGHSLQGHASFVYTVAFSPNSTRIVSGSWDKTIRLWDANDGTAIGTPLQGHTNSVMSVAFSADGTRLVSCSKDKTIRLWNAADGTAIGAPLRGHTDRVWSVAFSLDGTRIVSGSDDNTIRLWNAEDGTAIGHPLQGHTGHVTSVAFSPDGTRIVSGSFDNTIRMWNAADGTAIGTPLHDHTNSVMSVAFSAGGTRIVSGSNDNTIRLWNAEDGAAIGPPLRGHNGCVWSVAFSPDGTRIVSGSGDNTIRLWNAETKTAINTSIQGDTDTGRAVAYSSDSAHTVSASGSAIRKSKACPDIPPIDSWYITKDGWIVDSASRLLFWIPQDLVGYVPLPPETCVIGPSGAIKIDYNSILLGEDWSKCYDMC